MNDELKTACFRFSVQRSDFCVLTSPVSLVYVFGDGVAQLAGLLLGERACDDPALLEADYCQAAVHLEVEGEAAAVVEFKDERGRHTRRAVRFKRHPWRLRAIVKDKSTARPVVVSL